jgi:hypothetical protein
MSEIPRCAWMALALLKGLAVVAAGGRLIQAGVKVGL